MMNEIFDLRERVLFRSILNGFCRVLRLLRDFDWINEPLIINFNHELTSNLKQNFFLCSLFFL